MRARSAAALIALALGITGAPGAAEDGTRTSKERLSDKASDDQRVDNCRVPIGRRGREPRPGCAGDPAPRPAPEPETPPRRN